jgi:hypothetical protein
MGALQPSFAEAVAAEERVQQRRAKNPDLAISRSEAEALLVLDRMQPDAAAAGRNFISSAVAEHLVASEPEGILTGEKTDWLIRLTAPNGCVETVAAFETLVRAVELAGEGAEPVAAFAIRQLRSAIISGEGPAIGARPHFSRIIDGQDAALLYRILTAAGGSAGRPVTYAEADTLFDLHDAVARSENDTSFNELFFHAIANYVLAASGHALEPRPVALAPGFVVSADLRPSTELSAWLSERIMRDGRPTLAEFELLLLIGAPTPKTGSSLRRLLDSAA